MAFDMGFDFRATAGYVTDPAYGVPVLGEAYPHTYTNANGNSSNAGWDSATIPIDRVSTNDPRIAGMNFDIGPITRIFTVDLSSGSAPGANTYAIDMAIGDANAGGAPVETLTTRILDDATELFTTGANFTNPGEYSDATDAIVAATTTWTGTPALFTFATTTCKLEVTAGSINNFTTTAHFRLTFISGPTPSGITGMPWWLIGPTILPGSDLMRSF